MNANQTVEKTDGERIAEKAEVLASLVVSGVIEGIDLDPATRIEHEAGRTYLVDRWRGEQVRDITHEMRGSARSAYSVFEEHLEIVEEATR